MKGNRDELNGDQLQLREAWDGLHCQVSVFCGVEHVHGAMWFVGREFQNSIFC